MIWKPRGGERRAGLTPSTRGRAPFRAYLRRNWLRLAVGTVVLGAALAVLLAVDVALGWSGFPLGFLAGLMVGLITSYCVWLILEVSGARSHAIGAIAEEWTAQALASLGPEWRRVHSVPFGNLFDIDHVVIGPAGVFAVETKFTAPVWTFDSDSLGLGERHALDGASRSQTKIRNLLHNAGRPQVTPMLVVWGPGVRDMPSLQVVKDVLVCNGHDPGVWLRHMQAHDAVLSGTQVIFMAETVEEHIARTEARSRLSRDPTG